MARTSCPRVSEGTRLLWEAKDKLGLGTRKLAAHLGWNPGKLSRFLNADGEPSIHTAVELEEKLGIPCVAWTQEPTKKFVVLRFRRQKLAA
jgi:ribosome-binding protein aMBF1 (putative translation factor)